MKPYLAVFVGTLQRAFQYRARIFTYAFINTFSPLLMIVIWTGYYQSGRSVGHFSYTELVSYYLAVTLITLVGSRVQSNVTEDIKDGQLTNYVIKPFNYFYFRLSWELAWHVVKFITFASAVFIIITISGLRITFATGFTNIVAALISFFLAYILSFSFSILIGSVAFFITETTGITNLFEMLSDLITGKIFPLTFFPLVAEKIISFTPFASMVYFPSQAALGNLHLPELLGGILTQLFWIIVLISLYQITWKRGIAKFSGVGL